MRKVHALLNLLALVIRELCKSAQCDVTEDIPDASLGWVETPQSGVPT